MLAGSIHIGAGLFNRFRLLIYSHQREKLSHVENLLLGCSHAFHAVNFNPVQPHLVATSNDKVHLGQSLAVVAVLVFTSLCKGWSWFVGLASTWLLLAPVWRCVELWTSMEFVAAFNRHHHTPANELL